MTKLQIISHSFNNTIFVGKVCWYLEEIDSTNTYANQLLQHPELPPEGTVIAAKCQYGGKGMRGNVWYSEAGKNIITSIVLYPPPSLLPHQFAFSQAMSLGMLDFARAELGDKAFIKWPNDLYYNHNKLGGMLIENTVAGSHWRAAVVGIGINVNQTYFPPNLSVQPTSMALLTHQQYEIIPLLQKLCAAIENRYLSLKSDNLAGIQRDYLLNLLRFREYAYYQTANGLLYAAIVDVLPDGKLVLENEARQTLTFDLKTIKFLW